MEEKRKHIRIKAPIVVTYKLIGESPISKKTVAKNFSEGGIRLTIYERLQVGTSLDLRIETPFDTMPISVIGEVVWIKASGVKEGREAYDAGVKFTQMQTFDRERMVHTARSFLNMGKQYRAE